MLLDFVFVFTFRTVVSYKIRCNIVIIIKFEDLVPFLLFQITIMNTQGTLAF